MELAIRNCLGCGQSDDHPRHITVVADGTEVAWHMDCHALTGCEVCQSTLEDVTGMKGDQLREFLMNKGGE